jgi:hypothetical protein
MSKVLHRNRLVTSVGRVFQLVRLLGTSWKTRPTENCANCSGAVPSKMLPVAAMLGLGIAMFFPGAVWAVVERFGGVEISVQPLPSKDNRFGGAYGTRHGYVELRVLLRNLTSDERVVHLSYPTVRERWVSSGVVVMRSVRIAGGQAAAVSLYQPPQEVANETLDMQVDGVAEGRSFPVSSLHGWYDPSNANRSAVLLSRSVPQEFWDLARAKASSSPSAAAAPAPIVPPGSAHITRAMVAASAPSTPAADPLALLRSELPVSQWSASWLGYSCFDAVVLTAKDAEEMPAAVQLALRRYMECGGTVLVHGKDVPAIFSEGRVDDGKGGYAVGFGRLLTGSDSKTVADPKSSLLQSLSKRLGGGSAVKKGWEATYDSLSNPPTHVYCPTERPSNLYELLVAEATVPVRGLFVLVLLFGIGIGPANLWLLSRYKRRIWLWWNVPAISLLTCLLVFAYSLLSEGISGQGKTASMTLLDERFHRASTIGYISYYCPLTPSTGPQFGVDTDVTRLEDKTEPWRRYMGGRTSDLRQIDWTKNQYLLSGWVTARVPTYFQFRKNEDRRERLSVEKKSDGTLKVVNALGADIQHLYWADASGRIFEGYDIPAGAEQTLAVLSVKGKPQVASNSAGARQAFLRGAFCTEWVGEFNNVMKGTRSPSALLSPGCYLAYLDKSPFVESPLPSVDSEHSAAIVYGISNPR